MNYKGLAFETVWVEYPDIKDVSQKLGAAPTIDEDGTENYTLPMIHDPSTGAVIQESRAIAEYLDVTYPDTPRVIPDGTRGLQLAFSDAMVHNLAALSQFALPAVNAVLNPRSAEYFRRTREASLGMTMEQLLPSGERREKQWKRLEDAVGNMDKWFGKDSLLIGGSPDTPIFADFELAGRFIWAKKVFGADSEEWKSMSSWHGGRWARLVQSLEKYE